MGSVGAANQHMTELSEALVVAVQDHQAGRIEAAEAAYRQILRIDPRHSEALRLSGLIAHQRGQHQLAVDLVCRAIAIRPTPLHYLNLGMAYEGLDQFERAVESYRRALELDPTSVDALNCLGNSYRARGAGEAAVGCYRAAVAARPEHALAHYNLGGLLYERGDLDGALIHCSRAAALDPNEFDAHINLGNVHRARGEFTLAADCYRRALAISPNNGLVLNNLGNVFALQGDEERALDLYRAAAAALPDFALAHYNLAGLLLERGDLAGAHEHSRRAVLLDPSDADSQFRLGCVLDQRNEIAAAMDCYQGAIALKPGHAQAHCNLGLLHLNQGEPLSARAGYDRAIASNPEHAKAHVGRAMVDLMLGDWSRGWNEYEWRWRIKNVPPPLPGIASPSWSGEPLCGARILLVDEQGIGDALQFVRYAPLVADLGGRVLLRVRPGLRRILATVRGVESVSTFDEPLPQFDAHCPLLSLPRAIGTRVETVPGEVPYLSADADRVVEWRRRLGAHGFKIGICWQGGTKKTGLSRSFPPGELRRISSIPGVRLISLQKPDAADPAGPLDSDMPVELPGPDFDAGPDAFLDTAALIESLDLVITCDTSIAHLAGALARPAWIALQYAADWRWMSGRDTSPWYPTHRLFRQSTSGQWSDVFDSMYQRLAARAATDSTP